MLLTMFNGKGHYAALIAEREMGRGRSNECVSWGGRGKVHEREIQRKKPNWKRETSFTAVSDSVDARRDPFRNTTIQSAAAIWHLPPPPPPPQPKRTGSRPAPSELETAGN
ncbi:hypothetical protein TIFTF001_016827 [Ficus carica]|uniref:Uncharacterized protein n=1 Tax=Ficus carica TaxID=3494 RepID=A0AA88AB41_FICCA|nr:hypothetical protein TIFTF001_016827 [Ficus carica]